MPLGPAEYAIVLAASSALRMPSEEVASIFGAPARIATPMPELATLTRLSPTTLISAALAIPLSITALTAASFAQVATCVPIVMALLLPAAFLASVVTEA